MKRLALALVILLAACGDSASFDSAAAKQAWLDQVAPFEPPDEILDEVIEAIKTACVSESEEDQRTAEVTYALGENTGSDSNDAWDAAMIAGCSSPPKWFVERD